MLAFCCFHALAKLLKTAAVSHSSRSLDRRPIRRMKSITRYILAEFIKTFGVSLGAMTALTILIFLAQEGLQQGLGPAAIVQLIPYVLPNALYVAIPGTMLFSACLVYGRMSATNEILAVSAMGVPVFRLIRPVLILAAIISLVTLWLNDVAVSWGREGAYRVVLQSVEQTIYSILRSNKSFDSNTVSITVAGLDDRRMIYPTVSVRDKHNDETRTISAETAELQSFPQRGVMTLTMLNGSATLGKDGTFLFDKISPEVSLVDLTKKDGGLKSASNLPLLEIPKQIEHQERRLQAFRKRTVMQAGLQMLNGDFGDMTTAWKQRARELKNAETRNTRLHTEPWRRWANGFSCLFFVTVGIPLSIQLKNADVWTCFGICFLPILVIYFPLMLLGIDRAKAGALPPCSVWIGNLVLLIVGLILMRRVMKH